jgi:hypothetical protein
MRSDDQTAGRGRKCGLTGKNTWRNAGTVLGVLVMLAAGSLVWSQSVESAPGCGPEKEKFEVKTEKHVAPAVEADARKAMVYFIEDDKQFLSVPKPTVRAGIDGAWVGATHGTSYFSVAVEPGERHVCAVWQSKVVLLAGLQSAALHFTAEAGKTYYFRIRNKWNKEQPTEMKLEALDSDAGKLLVGQFAQSVFRKK